MPAARSGVRPPVALIDGGALKRSVVSSVDWPGRLAGRRRSSSVMGRSRALSRRRGSDASGRRPRRNDPRLAQRDRQRTERDLAGVERQDTFGVDALGEAVHAARRGAELRTGGLDAEPVVARAVARALQPEIADARIRLA